MEKTLLNVSFTEAVALFMTTRGWTKCICEQCRKVYFAKNNSRTLTCGWNNCNSKAYLFRKLSKKKRRVSPQSINNLFVSFFSSRSFINFPALNVASPQGKTDLVGAGVQMFDGIIHNSEPVLKGNYIIAQPSIRMQYQAEVEKEEGVSTAFINICTEKIEGDIEEHLLTVDLWLSFLSSLGLHMNDFSIIMRDTSMKDWGTGQFVGMELFFVYSGLELGDAAYLEIPQRNRNSLQISDIGFGLERIAWAINKTESYFDMLKPLSCAGSNEMFDACRSLSLLALSGVTPSNKGPGLQFRRLARTLSEKYYHEDVYQIISYYFNYWASFTKPLIHKEKILHSIRLEIERLISSKISDELKLPPPKAGETLEDYLDRLVYNDGVDVDRVRETVQHAKYTYKQ